MSKKLNPECEHHLGDMRTFRLGRTFDAVFIQDAICHLTTLDEVNQTLERAFLHTRPGGVLLIAPDHTKEKYRPLRAACANGQALRQQRGGIDRCVELNSNRKLARRCGVFHDSAHTASLIWNPASEQHRHALIGSGTDAGWQKHLRTALGNIHGFHLHGVALNFEFRIPVEFDSFRSSRFSFHVSPSPR